jgi:lipoprotein-releasing system permease protein
MMGITISTAALIVVLSAFNGLEDLVESLYSAFDSDIRITVAEGKTFDAPSFQKEKIRKIKGVKYYTDVVEEIAIIKYGDHWVHATIKGVEDDFLKMSELKNDRFYGELILQEEGFDFAVIGSGIQARLGAIIPEHDYTKLTIFGPARTKVSGKENPFNTEEIILAGVFSINAEFDMNYVLAPKSYVSKLLAYGNDISAVEIGLEEGVDAEEVQREIQRVVGNRFEVKTRYQQNELVYKTNKTEKWITFLILCFILVIATFNIIASLTMLVLDKKQDIRILTGMGANRSTVRKIFFLEGLLINVIGGALGLLIGFAVCMVQLKFKVITLQDSVVDAYPVNIEAVDFLSIAATVLVIGVISSWIPVQYLVRKHF